MRPDPTDPTSTEPDPDAEFRGHPLFEGLRAAALEALAAFEAKHPPAPELEDPTVTKPAEPEDFELSTAMLTATATAIGVVSIAFPDFIDRARREVGKLPDPNDPTSPGLSMDAWLATLPSRCPHYFRRQKGAELATPRDWWML